MELLVPVDGGTVWAQDTGGDGMPVVLLHPRWGDSRIWDAVLHRLSTDTRTIRTDVRGFGRSAPSAVPFTPLADLIAVLDHLAVSAAVVVGHSGGGGTALGLAIAEPERVSALVLLAPGVPDYPWPEDDPYFAEFDALLSAGDRQGLVALARRTWASDDHDPAVEEQLRSATAAYAEQGDLMRSEPPILDRLNTIGVPVTILIGAEDHPMVIECASAIAARLATCRTAMLPGVDHMVPLRVPDLVAATLTVR